MITNSVFLVILLIIIVVPVVVLSLFVVSLLGFHVYLMILGRTTKETLTKSSPFKGGETPVLSEKQDLGGALFDASQAEELQQEKKPYLCFALPLLKEEVDYLGEFDFCATGDMRIVEM